MLTLALHLKETRQLAGPNRMGGKAKSTKTTVVALAQHLPCIIPVQEVRGFALAPTVCRPDSVTLHWYT